MNTLNRHTRRALLRLGAEGAAVVGGGALLAACTTTSSGGTSTATLNVAKVQAYTQAGINFAQTVLATPALVTLLGATNQAKVATLLGELNTKLAAFEAAAGSAVSVSFNSTSAVTIAQSILADIQTVLSIVTPLVAVLAGPVGTSIAAAVSAASTIAALLQAMLSVGSASVTATAPVTAMDESKALATLGVN